MPKHSDKIKLSTPLVLIIVSSNLLKIESRDTENNICIFLQCTFVKCSRNEIYFEAVDKKIWRISIFQYSGLSIDFWCNYIENQRNCLMHISIYFNRRIYVFMFRVVIKEWMRDYNVFIFYVLDLDGLINNDI